MMVLMNRFVAEEHRKGKSPHLQKDAGFSASMCYCHPPVGGRGGTYAGGDDACARSAMVNVVTVGITKADAIPAFFSTDRRDRVDS